MTSPNQQFTDSGLPFDQDDNGDVRVEQTEPTWPMPRRLAEWHLRQDHPEFALGRVASVGASEAEDNTDGEAIVPGQASARQATASVVAYGQALRQPTTTSSDTPRDEGGKVILGGRRAVASPQMSLDAVGQAVRREADVAQARRP